MLPATLSLLFTLTLNSQLIQSYSNPIDNDKHLQIKQSLVKLITLTNRVTSSDYLISLGRVGKITRSTSKTDLSKDFGSKNLKDYISHGAEGEGDFPATKVILNGKIVLVIIWVDYKQQQIASVIIYDSHWHTSEGIRVGMTVDEMQRIFGKFKFYGLEWDYGGQLILGNQKLDRFRKTNNIDMVFGMPEGVCNQSSLKSCEAIIGEQILSSADSAVRQMKVQISSLKVSF